MNSLCQLDLRWPVPVPYEERLFIWSEMSSIFDEDDLLKAYDRILPLAKHYKDVLSIHLRELAPCRDIIDLGCGTGILTIKFLATEKLITAVDISQKSLNILSEKAISHGYSDRLKLLEADVTHLDQIPSDYFDGANSMIVAHLLQDYEMHVKESYRVLKPGGRFVITARNAEENPERLVKSTKDSLVAIGAYEELESDFALLAEKLLRTANTRSNSLMTAQEAEALLYDVGFQSVQRILNETFGVMYTLVAHKP